LLAQPFDYAQGKQNEPKEKALFQQVFFEEIFCKISSKTIFQKLNFLQGFKNF
jgi:hypothetical protein